MSCWGWDRRGKKGRGARATRKGGGERRGEERRGDVWTRERAGLACHDASSAVPVRSACLFAGGGCAMMAWGGGGGRMESHGALEMEMEMEMEWRGGRASAGSETRWGSSKWRGNVPLWTRRSTLVDDGVVDAL